MSQPSKARPFVVGLALFSMFFGSGNLVFPLVVGTLSQSQSTFATAGFVLTGVLLPFFGILAMLRFDGKVRDFFHFALGPRFGFLACLILLSIWIPLGSAPRCITVSYAAIKQLIPSLPLWLFSLGACAAIFPVCLSRSRMLDLLGYILTPVLLACLALILGIGLYQTSSPELIEGTASGFFLTGLHEGYNTMDLIASIFFSAVVVAKFKSAEGNHIQLAWKSSVIGASLLAAVYLGFITVAAGQASTLTGVPREELLLVLAQQFLGQAWAIIPILAIALSCITTCIALIYIYSEFLSDEVFKGKISMPQATAISIALTFGLSILGFAGIAKLVTPMLEFSYPFLIILMVVNVSWQYWKQVQTQSTT